MRPVVWLLHFLIYLRHEPAYSGMLINLAPSIRAILIENFRRQLRNAGQPCQFSMTGNIASWPPNKEISAIQYFWAQILNVFFLGVTHCDLCTSLWERSIWSLAFFFSPVTSLHTPHRPESGRRRERGFLLTRKNFIFVIFWYQGVGIANPKSHRLKYWTSWKAAMLINDGDTRCSFTLGNYTSLVKRVICVSFSKRMLKSREVHLQMFLMDRSMRLASDPGVSHCLCVACPSAGVLLSAQGLPAPKPHQSKL